MSKRTFDAGDNLLLTNEFRVASCSAVALLMMSIPGLQNHPFGEAPSPASMSPVLTPADLAPRPAPRKRFAFLRRPSMTGIASWYGAVLNGHKTASGETFDMNQMTACHRTLPFGTMVRVTDTQNGKSVVVRINDRGVLFADRVIDLSRGAADKLGIRSLGTAKVRLEVLTRKQAAAANEMAAANLPDPISPTPSAVQASR